MQTGEQKELIDAELQKKEIHIQQIVLSKGAVQYLAQGLTEEFQKITLFNVNLNSIGVFYLSQSSTANLREIYLNCNRIGNRGCKYLTKANWSNLQYLCLNQNGIDTVGVHHISKGRWPLLKDFVIMGNPLSNDYIRMIMRANFPNVQRLSFTNKFVRTPQLARNSLSLNEVKLLFLSEWRYIQLLWLNDAANNSDYQLGILKGLLKLKLPTSCVFLR